MDHAIQIKNLKKKFSIPREKRTTLKENILHFHRRVIKEDFQALDDVSLNISPGEFIGIIGRNGSGKSTLLKIMANIYKPTSGEVIVNGNVSPFLELGIGFNGDLSARENVYLNGIILGLSRKEIDAKYKQIVLFADLHDFMEMKLKNYSSGMQVRLAFAIAAIVDADIYLCDEVLAVGDIDFQRKSLNTFADLKKKGKTVVYVSHDLDSIKNFCTKTILLEKGKVIKAGDTHKVVDYYIQKSEE
jgi:ABC-type polysaccharide/polyol phosphate transport system ATPase subunit